MWPKTIITQLLNITLPLIQAPMAGGATTPELVAAASNTGGLGSLGAGYMAPDELRQSIRKIKSLSQKPFAVNLFIPEKHHATHEQIKKAKDIVEVLSPELNYKLPFIIPPYTQSFEDQMAIVLEEKVPVFSFTFGVPSDDWLDKFKKGGILLKGTATTLQEAMLLEDHGIDIIVAQGSEAGGHRGTFLGKSEDGLTGTMALMPILVDHVKTPIVAAGGIMDARGIVAALMLGASGVQMGTAFLACPESGIHPKYKEILLNIEQDNTMLTRAFSGKFARGIKNKFSIRMQSHADCILDYPIQHALTIAMRKEAAKQGNTDFMSMWAGQAVHLCKNVSAAELIRSLNNEVMKLLNLNH